MADGTRTGEETSMKFRRRKIVYPTAEQDRAYLEDKLTDARSWLKYGERRERVISEPVSMLLRKQAG